jgi:hypothetical protein
MVCFAPLIAKNITLSMLPPLLPLLLSTYYKAISEPSLKQKI